MRLFKFKATPVEDKVFHNYNPQYVVKCYLFGIIPFGTYWNDWIDEPVVFNDPLVAQLEATLLNR